jgi:hypothetical protein
MIKAYEVHTYRHGRWALSAIFDDMGLARRDAAWLERTRACFGVRIIEEKWSPRSGRMRVRTVFRSGARSAAPPPADTVRWSGEAGIERVARPDPTRWVLAMVGIIVAGMAAGVALGELRQIDW